MYQTYGERIRQARRVKGLTLDRLAGSLGMSKSYLSLIETGRLANPPIDDKLLALENALGFARGELLHEAQLHRTPGDIKAILATLAGGRAAPGDAAGVDLDSAYLSGVLHRAVEAAGPNVQSVALRTVPVVNCVSAGGLSEFADLPHPKADADTYAPCPADVNGGADPDAFAARVSGDSMAPKYAPGDVVVFSPAAPVRDGDDCFVRLDNGQTTFKRVYFETDAAGYRLARLEPRNPNYDTRRVPADTVAGVFRAVYRVQPLTAD